MNNGAVAKCLFFNCECSESISKPLKNKRLLRHFVPRNDTIIVFCNNATIIF